MPNPNQTEEGPAHHPRQGVLADARTVREIPAVVRNCHDRLGQRRSCDSAGRGRFVSGHRVAVLAALRGSSRSICDAMRERASAPR